MIKKTLLGLFITLVGILNFSNAGYTRQIGVYGQNPYAQSFDISFLRTGNPLTQSLGYTKQTFVFIQGNYTRENNGSTAPIFITWFWKNGLPYYYIYRGYYWGDGEDYFKQGNITQYQVCDEITNPDSTTKPGNCTSQNIGETTNTTLGNYFDAMTNNDYYYFNYSRAWRDKTELNLDFCFSNTAIGSSLCFNVNGNSTLNNSIGLTGNLTFDNIQTSLFENPPTNGNGGNNNTNVSRNRSNYYCPTYKEVLQNYGNNYNTGLCYNGTLKYENGSITTVQKKDIFTVFSNYDEYTQRINLYYNNCNTPATQQQCESTFSGQREKYSIIANVKNNGVDDKGLWNYCNIGLNYDLNTTTCVANTGSTYKEPITSNELIDYIENLTDIGTVITPSTGNILNGLLEEGQTREDINPRDLIGNLDQIKEKLSTIFTERNGVNGIIPNYIMWLILVSLLLTVLLKK